jgi:hypothetical protein
MTGGASGGGWLTSISNGQGYMTSVSSCGYPSLPAFPFGPYQGNTALSLFSFAQSIPV